MKILRNILLIIVVLFLLIFAIGILAGNDNEITEFNSVINSTDVDELESMLNEIRTDSWTDSHLSLYNYKKPEVLKKQVEDKRIVVRSKIMTKDYHYFYIGVNANVNIKCEFKDQDDFDNIKTGQDIILQGVMTTGSLPRFNDVVIIDTIQIKNRITELNSI